MSFRPICLPNSINIKVEMNEKSRAEGTVTCDGYQPFNLGKNEMLEINISDRRIKSMPFWLFSGVWISPTKSNEGLDRQAKGSAELGQPVFGMIK